MTKAFSTYNLLLAVLLFVFCSLVQAEVNCQSNGCDGCCVPSRLCSDEHTLTSETNQCRHPQPPPEPPSIPGRVEQCQFDFFTGGFEPCQNSRVDNLSESVGDYGKPSWVGAEFQSVAFDTFSMTVMWQHRDAEIPSSLPNLSPVQGYEIRIYKMEAGRSEVVRLCFCVTDPNIRNISDIHHGFFEYNEMSHMIVEVRTFPSLIGRDERNMRRNCSLLTGCTTTEDCVISHDNCYSWPQSCLNILPSYNPLTCAPPFYGPPVNLKAEMTLVDDNFPDSVAGKLDLSWEPPMMNYDLFPVPNTYYVTVESISDNSTFIFKVVNSTSISILSLNNTMYRVVVKAYVPCSGLSHNKVILSTGDAGCGSPSLTLVDPPTPPPITTTFTSTTTMLTTANTKITLVPTNTIVAIAVVVLLSAAVIIICIFAVLMILWRKRVRTHKTKSNISSLCVPNDIPLGLPPKPNTNICVFVFYPKNIELEDETFIQTYLVAALSKHAEIKDVKSSDDPYFERGSIPESIDKKFRQADFVLIVCNSIFLSEWNCNECSPSVQLLKRYMGNLSIRSDDSISKFITVVLDEQKKQLLSHSILNLGSLRSFMVTESTWEKEVENIVQYMTGTPLFQITTQEHSLDVLNTLESPGTPLSDIVPDSSQESHIATPRTSDSSLSDSKDNHDIIYTQDGEAV